MLNTTKLCEVNWQVSESQYWNPQFRAADMQKFQPLNSLTQLQTGPSMEIGTLEQGVCICEYRKTPAYTPLHHYLMSPTRLQEQPNSLCNSSSRKEASLKHLMTKRAVENIVGGEYTYMYCTKLKKQIHEMRASWLRDTQITSIKVLMSSVSI